MGQPAGRRPRARARAPLDCPAGGRSPDGRACQEWSDSSGGRWPPGFARGSASSPRAGLESPRTVGRRRLSGCLVAAPASSGEARLDRGRLAGAAGLPPVAQEADLDRCELRACARTAGRRRGRAQARACRLPQLRALPGRPDAAAGTATGEGEPARRAGRSRADGTRQARIEGPDPHRRTHRQQRGGRRGHCVSGSAHQRGR